MEQLVAGLVVKTELKGKVLVQPISARRRFWKIFGAMHGFPLIAEAANRLLSMHVTSCSSERNWSLWGRVFTAARNRLGKERGEMMIYIRGNSKSVANDSFAVTLSVIDEEQEL